MDHPERVRRTADSFFCALTFRRLWLLVPSLILVRLGKDLAADLTLANKVSAKTASGKSN